LAGPARLTDNLARLLGLHGLAQHFTAQLLRVSEATMSTLLNGKSTPSPATGNRDRRALPDFDRSPDGAESSDLLAHELAEPFERVETRIKRGRSKLKSV
jgi:transcriptional regulator with XRE-family HTH domain